jgi:hypothetical protein
MLTSDTTKELITALCQFQSATLKATKKNLNPAFKTKYSSINDVLEAVLPTLTENGLCFVQFPDGGNLTTRLMHVSGEWMEASYTLNPVQNTPQAGGSAITYARRYALLAVLGLGTEDDDGHAASQPGRSNMVGAPAMAGEYEAALRELADGSAVKTVWDRYPELHNHAPFKAALKAQQGVAV